MIPPGRIAGLRLALLLLAAAAALAGCGAQKLEETAPAREPAPRIEPAPAPAPQLFAADSIWNAPLPAAAPADPDSAAIVAGLVAEVGEEVADREGPSISTTRYSVPIYTVPVDQPTVRVELTSPTPAPALQAAFEAVPLPPDAKPSGGTDANLVVYQPSTDRLWEFWRFVPAPSGPSASWGGAIDRVSTNRGVYGPEAWPGAKPWWGSSASSLSIAGGLITVADLEAGEIDHALALAVPDVRAGVFALPAQGSDGTSGSSTALPEGARLRLDPGLDLDTLHLPPLTRMIAAAAQRYGIYVRDGASVVHFFAQDPVNLGRDPYAGADGYFEGHYPGELLAAFPWERLEVMPMELRADED